MKTGFVMCQRFFPGLHTRRYGCLRYLISGKLILHMTGNKEEVIRWLHLRKADG